MFAIILGQIISLQTVHAPQNVLKCNTRKEKARNSNENTLPFISSHRSLCSSNLLCGPVDKKSKLLISFFFFFVENMLTISE